MPPVGSVAKAAVRVGRVCLVSHRLGGYDGVSVEAAKWQDAFIRLGYSVTRVGGYFADRVDGTDVELAGLWAAAPGGRPPPADTASIDRLCRTHDLLVLDNVGSLPSAPEAALAFEQAALRYGIPTIVRHHDPPWQVSLPRRGGLPLTDARMLHVTINGHTEEEFRQRFPALARADALTTIHNTVDVAALKTGDRRATRRAMAIADDDILIAHPARNVERKNIPAAIDMAARLQRHTGKRVHYWLTDRAGALVAPADGPTIHRGQVRHAADLYAAADLVALPSVWEGWGLPVVEAAAAQRVAVTHRYPVLTEIHRWGIGTIDHHDVESLGKLLDDPVRRRAFTASNYRMALRFDVRGLPGRLDRAQRRARELMSAGQTRSLTPVR